MRNLKEVLFLFVFCTYFAKTPTIAEDINNKDKQYILEKTRILKTLTYELFQDGNEQKQQKYFSLEQIMQDEKRTEEERKEKLKEQWKNFDKTGLLNFTFSLYEEANNCFNTFTNMEIYRGENTKINFYNKERKEGGVIFKFEF